MKNENDEKMKNVDRAILDISTKNENEIFNSNEFSFFLRNLKRNVHIERSSSNAQNFVDENFENDQQFFNINESRKIKIKNRSKNSKNKKKFQTRAKKKAIKSTRRNFSKFEHVVVNLEFSQNRNRNRNRNRDRETTQNALNEKTRKNREKRDEKTRNARNEKVREKFEKSIVSLIIAQK